MLARPGEQGGSLLIPDLYEYPVGHPPDPYGLGIAGARYGMTAVGTLPPNVSLRAVGWLGNRVPRQGKTPPQCVDRLVEAYERELVFSDFSRGYHECELCVTPQPFGHAVVRWRGRQLRISGRGHFLVASPSSSRSAWWTRFIRPARPTVYMCPPLIVHYILDHGYRPPDEFTRAVVRGTFLRSDDLVLSNPLLNDEL